MDGAAAGNTAAPVRSLTEHLRENARLRRLLRDELLLVADEGDDRQAAELRDVALWSPRDVADRQLLVLELLELRDELRPVERMRPFDGRLERVYGAVAVQSLLAERSVLVELLLVRRVDRRPQLVRVAARRDAAGDDVEVLQVRHGAEPEGAVEAGAADDRQVDARGPDLLRRRRAARGVRAHE